MIWCSRKTIRSQNKIVGMAASDHLKINQDPGTVTTPGLPGTDVMITVEVAGAVVEPLLAM